MGSCVAEFVGGPCDGQGGLALPTDVHGQPMTTLVFTGEPVLDGDDDDPVKGVRYVYQLRIAMGGIAIYDYTGWDTG